MSLDQLPNDLIAHIGSFLHFDDNRQFGLSQKRIHKVLKRHRLDKPECNELQFLGLSEVNFLAKIPQTARSIVIIKEEQDVMFNTTIGQVMNKFRKIEKVLFFLLRDEPDVLKEDIFKEIIRTKAKLSSLRVLGYKIGDVDPNIFLTACKKFDKIYISSNGLSSALCKDEILIKLMPTTILQVYFNDGGISTNGSALTDKTLEAVAAHSTMTDFAVDNTFTSFTFKGVKKLFEIMAAILPEHGHHNLGVLKFEEEKNTIRWFNEAQTDPDSPYIIEREEPTHPDQVIKYTINIRGCYRYDEFEDGPCFCFGVYGQQV